jgi:hypothetical protein
MPEHVVVDGSNIATEGRQMPSLRQLKEAVAAFLEERPDSLITIVVDATFGHRIDPSEVAEFDDDVSNNRIVAPPAGAVGRGDAFVLSIAKKVKATILTNDSYQEFHHETPWLFEEGRLIGGKPVPHIGWVFVTRIPVRGAKSRKATADAKRKRQGGSAVESSTVRVGSADANQPMPVPKAPPPGPASRPPAESAAQTAAETAADKPAKHEKQAKGSEKAKKSDKGHKSDKGRKHDKDRAATSAAPSAVTSADEGQKPAAHVNDLMAFLSFVEQHPVGSVVKAVVDHYASHGAYVKVGDVVCYLPLRLMADPAPRSAREFVKLGDSLDLVVSALVPARRSIDVAVPSMSSTPVVAEAPSTKPAAAKKAVAKKSPVKKAPVKKAPAKKAPAAKAPPAEVPAKKAPAKKVAAAKVAAKKVGAAKAPAKKLAAAKAPAKKVAVAKAPAKPVAAKKVAAKKVPAKKAAR